MSKQIQISCVRESHCEIINCFVLFWNICCLWMIFGLQEVYMTLEPTVSASVSSVSGERLLLWHLVFDSHRKCVRIKQLIIKTCRKIFKFRVSSCRDPPKGSAAQTSTVHPPSPFLCSFSTCFTCSRRVPVPEQSSSQPVPQRGSGRLFRAAGALPGKRWDLLEYNKVKILLFIPEMENCFQSSAKPEAENNSYFRSLSSLSGFSLQGWTIILV